MRFIFSKYSCHESVSKLFEGRRRADAGNMEEDSTFKVFVSNSVTSTSIEKIMLHLLAGDHRVQITHLRSTHIN